MPIRPYAPQDETAVVALWQACGLVVPWNNPHKDIARKLATQPDLLLVCEDDGHIVGSVMVGYDGHRGWINYLAVAPTRQRQGLGQQLMAAAETRLQALGCPKINLQVRASNAPVIAFYESLGFQSDDVISLGKRLQSDENAP